MKEVFWIERYRKHLFAAQLLIAFVFGPAIGNNFGGGWYHLLFFAVVILTLEAFITIIRLSFAIVAKEKTSRILARAKAQSTEVKKGYTELTGERIESRHKVQGKKKRKRKGKKTHRN